MTATRHPPTLLLPDLPKQVLVGIDFLSLTASSRFNGFTTLPPGWHFLFVGATTELSSRQGIWFYVSRAVEDDDLHTGQKRARADSQPLGVRGQIIPSSAKPMGLKDWLAVLKWDPETERLHALDSATELADWRQKLLSSADLQKSLFPYRQTVQPDQRIQEVQTDESPSVNPPVDFISLSSHVSARLLDRLCGSTQAPFWSLDTAGSSAADAEAEHIPGLEGEEKFRGEPLGLLDIDLKRTWPESAVGRERTEAARDRSWRLGEVMERSAIGTLDQGHDGGHDGEPEEWGSEILGEMQFCFIGVLTLANWSCMAQWRRILELVMTCYAIVPQQASFFASFLALLSMQLTHTNLVEGGLFDVKDEGGEFLKDLLRRFNNTLSEMGDESDVARIKKEMLRLQETVKDIWGWELGDEWVRKGMVQLEDGEMVELETQDMEDEDERGEYAPVIVELDQS